MWIYCTSHAGIHGNEQADSLVLMAPITEIMGSHFTEYLSMFRLKVILLLASCRKTLIAHGLHDKCFQTPLQGNTRNAVRY